jgi:hypothetical protein
MIGIAFLGFWVACGVALHLACSLTGYYISAEKGRGGLEGFLFGLVFGPFGLLLAVLMPEPPMRREPVVAFGAVAGGILVAVLAVGICAVLRVSAP